jgi:hypothetical protein
MVRKKMSEEERKYKKRLYDIKYAKKNIIKIKELGLKRRNKNKIKKTEYDNKHRRDLRDKIFEILGSECWICQDNNIKFLTFDHVMNNGSERRKVFGSALGELTDLKKRGWPINEIKSNFQVLCYNHNCGKGRGYLNGTLVLSRYQRYRRKLWKQAFEFFGPCKVCGETNLQFLTTDHIHNDGAERRRNGECNSSRLLEQFRQQGWPESLKETYQILCFNHNCSKERKL